MNSLFFISRSGNNTLSLIECSLAQHTPKNLIETGERSVLGQGSL